MLFLQSRYVLPKFAFKTSNSILKDLRPDDQTKSVPKSWRKWRNRILKVWLIIIIISMNGIDVVIYFCFIVKSC